jgi:hypothetical protein
VKCFLLVLLHKHILHFTSHFLQKNTFPHQHIFKFSTVAGREASISQLLLLSCSISSAIAGLLTGNPKLLIRLFGSNQFVAGQETGNGEKLSTFAFQLLYFFQGELCMPGNIFKAHTCCQEAEGNGFFLSFLCLIYGFFYLLRRFFFCFFFCLL